MRTKSTNIKKRNEEIVGHYITYFYTYDTLAEMYFMSKENVRKIITPAVSKENRNKVYKIRTALNTIKNQENLIKKLKSELCK